MQIEIPDSSRETWLAVLKTAADAIYRHDGGIAAGDRWRSDDLYTAWISIRKAIQQVERDICK